MDYIALFVCFQKTSENFQILLDSMRKVEDFSGILRKTKHNQNLWNLPGPLRSGFTSTRYSNTQVYPRSGFSIVNFELLLCWIEIFHFFIGIQTMLKSFRKLFKRFSNFVMRYWILAQHDSKLEKIPVKMIDELIRLNSSIVKLCFC